MEANGLAYPIIAALACELFCGACARVRPTARDQASSVARWRQHAREFLSRAWQAQ